MQKYAPVQNVFWFYRRKYIQNGFSLCVKNIRCYIENATLVTMHKQEIRKNGKPMHKELTKNCVDALGTHLRPLPLSPTVRRTRGDEETQDWKRVRPVIVTGGGKWMSSDADMAKPPAGRGITFRYAMLRKTFAWRLEEAS